MVSIEMKYLAIAFLGPSELEIVTVKDNFEPLSFGNWYCISHCPPFMCRSVSSKPSSKIALSLFLKVISLILTHTSSPDVKVTQAQPL